jgi:hypothetical protein
LTEKKDRSFRLAISKGSELTLDPNVAGDTTRKAFDSKKNNVTEPKNLFWKCVVIVSLVYFPVKWK